jgi:hypothetical protein
LEQQLILNRVDWIPHFMGHCSIYKLQQFFFSLCDIIHNFRRDVYYLKQIKLLVI